MPCVRACGRAGPGPGEGTAAATGGSGSGHGRPPQPERRRPGLGHWQRVRRTSAAACPICPGPGKFGACALLSRFDVLTLLVTRARSAHRDPVQVVTRARRWVLNLAATGQELGPGAPIYPSS
jgi:hypothetical protein